MTSQADLAISDPIGVVIEDPHAVVDDDDIGPQKRRRGEASEVDNDDDESPIATLFEYSIKSEADTFIAQEMSKLSQSEREKIYYDIHGVNTDYYPEETTKLIERSLKGLKQQIIDIHTTDPKLCQAYDTALSIDSEYVQNPDFQLRFIRTDRFDVEAAAIRLMKHFQVKLELFGRDLLAKHILQDDLEEHTKGALVDGYKQVLPLRDRAGRLVYIDMTQHVKCDDDRSFETRWKRKFYSAMVASEDVETQRRGCVGICYAVDAPNVRYELGFLRRNIAIMEGMPLRFDALHMCHNNYMAWGANIAMFQIMTTLSNSMRTRVHYGSHSECLFILQTFGIPVSVMPLNGNGQATIDQNIQIWERRREYERRMFSATSNEVKDDGVVHSIPDLSEEKDDEETAYISKTANLQTPEDIQEPTRELDSFIFSPSQFDVLLGRGKGFHCHVGNVRFRNIIQELKSQYEDSTRDQKKEMTKDVVRHIQSIPGRFLKQDSETKNWVVVDDEEARLKVSHTFRNLKKGVANKSNNSGISSKRGRQPQNDNVSETFGRQFHAVDEEK